MTEEFDRLIETLSRVEALYAGATTPGERDAAASARERIQARLDEYRQHNPPEERQFSISDPWSRMLFIALARRYNLNPYRYYRQRRSTVMLKIPERFLKEVFWPEFMGINDKLLEYLNETAEKVIKAAVGEVGDIHDESRPVENDDHTSGYISYENSDQ